MTPYAAYPLPEVPDENAMLTTPRRHAYVVPCAHLETGAAITRCGASAHRIR
jgi:hypothetical protein